MNPQINAFFDAPTNTISYIVSEPNGKHCAIIDPVLDFDQKSGRTGTASADKITAFIHDHGLFVEWILETHVHADHLSAAPYLKKQLGGRIAIGEHIVEVQKIFKKLFNVEPGFAVNGAQFDHLFEDHEQFNIGQLNARVIHTPGHTPACITYVIGNAAFVGDTLFMPDYGTARADFPGGDAVTLFHSIQKILALPPQTRLFMCHDYGPQGRDYAWESSVAEELANNIHIRNGVRENDFVEMRTARDKTLSMPALLFPSVQVNMRAGQLPPAENNGITYLKLPLNADMPRVRNSEEDQ